jgi:hypothetical protein
MSNKIFDHKPKTWQELEKMVYTAFAEMGYESKKNITIKTIRGHIAIDVMAIDNKTPIQTTVVCECKHWNKRVNQQTIHAFRSVCADVGAHYGLVIAKNGFQSGAKLTRQNTNICLLDFDQFQDKYFPKWREAIFMKIVAMRDTFLPKLYRDEKLVSKALLKYSLFEKVSDYFILNERFPISIVDPRGDINSKTSITLISHRHFFDIANDAYDNINKYI